jgi:hypothetical protein
MVRLAEAKEAPPSAAVACSRIHSGPRASDANLTQSERPFSRAESTQNSGSLQMRLRSPWGQLPVRREAPVQQEVARLREECWHRSATPQLTLRALQSRPVHGRAS